MNTKSALNPEPALMSAKSALNLTKSALNPKPA
jgi:hypothetical protein